MKLIVNTDGGAAPTNPGPAAIGVVVREDALSNDSYHEISRYIGVHSNNYAEYAALIAALEYLGELKTYSAIHSVEFRLDSELVVKQMRGEYACRNEQLRDLYIEAQALLVLLNVPYKFVHIMREFNSEADALANLALDREALRLATSQK